MLTISEYSTPLKIILTCRAWDALCAGQEANLWRIEAFAWASCGLCAVPSNTGHGKMLFQPMEGTHLLKVP